MLYLRSVFCVVELFFPQSSSISLFPSPSELHVSVTLVEVIVLMADKVRTSVHITMRMACFATFGDMCCSLCSCHRGSIVFIFVV